MSIGSARGRPALGEHDTWSYLDGGLMPHEVTRIDENGTVHLDGAPSYRYDELNAAPTLCRSCSYELARSLGFTGPVDLFASYQPWLPGEAEHAMVRHEDGKLVEVAAYSYGRAYFEPGEPRTAPCEKCAAETLIDTLSDTPNG